MGRELSLCQLNMAGTGAVLRRQNWVGVGIPVDVPARGRGWIQAGMDFMGADKKSIREAGTAPGARALVPGRLHLPRKLCWIQHRPADDEIRKKGMHVGEI